MLMTGWFVVLITVFDKKTGSPDWKRFSRQETHAWNKQYIWLSHLENKAIFFSPAEFSCMFPRNSENCFFCIHPFETGKFITES